MNAAPAPIPAPLPSAPPGLVQQGAPCCGRYQGAPARLDWQGLQGPWARSAWWRRLHHKRWHYAGLATPQCFIGLALVDVGWTNTAFVYLFDRQRRDLPVNINRNGLPGLTARISDSATQDASWFRSPGVDLRICSAAPGRWQVGAWVRGLLDLQATLELPPTQQLMTAIGPIAGGGCVHATVKSSALLLQGQAVVGAQRYALDGGVASFDYSNGLLARHTAWRWASAHSPAVGFNLQQGYFGGWENTLWLDGQPLPLAAAQFDFDAAQPLQPWRIRTDDGLLDLRFEPEGARQKSQQLLVAASEYIQPVGCFHGTVRAHAGAPPVTVQSLLGVTEDHRSTW
ncbi:MAG: DUF2804 domain-containing protein [Rhodoferax sp.]